MDAFNKKDVEDLLPELVETGKRLQPSATKVLERMKEFTEKAKLMIERGDKMLKLSEEMETEWSYALAKTESMVKNPLQRLDYTYQLLEYYLRKGSSTSLSSGKETVEKNRNRSEGKANRKSLQDIPESRINVDKEQMLEMQKELSHVNKLKEGNQEKGLQVSYYCACRGKKSMSFEAYTNHMFSCHNNVVPEGSSHDLDGTLRRPKPRVPQTKRI